MIKETTANNINITVMKSWFRTLGSFLYTAVVCMAFLALSAFLLPKLILFAENFWKAIGSLLVVFFVFLWLSEKGVEIASIPYNWLWDRTKKTRIATIIPAVVVGILCLLIPFHIGLPHNVGGWLVVISWWLSALFFYYNMVTLPIINPNMGRVD